MNLIYLMDLGIEGLQPCQRVAQVTVSGRISRVGRGGQQPRKPQLVKHRRLRCDCGQIAVTVLLLRVGINPQYTIHLPLCRDCLALEHSLQNDG